ncbi:glycosyltransferase [Sulfurospirillum diekertiae]|nr:glycosyltransferase family 1 protein [Sulfurospirillum diekertiae]
MAHGIPTIVNTNGSMQELPNNSVLKLKDDFEDQELVDAMNALYENTGFAKILSTNAQEVILREHSPQVVVKKIQEIIQEISISSNQEVSLEQFYSRNISNGIIPNNDDLSNLAKQFELDTRYNKTPSLYVDISAVAIHDLKTGIQRVVRSILLALLKMPLKKYKIIPVYLTDKGGYWHYRVAHTFMYTLIPNLISRADTVIEPSSKDIFLGLDYYTAVTEAIQYKLFETWKQRGVNINFVIYDILPITLPHCFPPTSCPYHTEWLNTICQVADNLLCISNTVANEVKKHIDTLRNNLCNVPNIKYFHLGADLDNSLPSKGLPKNAGAILQHITSRITFLMVGTVEPRKGHNQTLMAFEELWDKEIDINLIIVGKEGWNVDILSEKLHHHKQLNHHLFWLESTSDEYLEQIYQASTCLIAASEGEGFGLPLIEAAQHNIPIIARDILVFREVASNYAYYFDNDNAPIVLAKVIEEWLTLYQSEKYPKSDEMPWLTWDESANSLIKNILGEN